MNLLRLHALPPTVLPPLAVTIGNFDGVHLGHQAMLRTLKKTAQANGLSTLVMIFEPQPPEFFKPHSAPPRITSFREKVELLAAQGVDYVLVARFDDAFRSLGAQAFADILRYQLNARALVLGDDFRFGADRMGDTDFLRAAKFKVIALDTIDLQGRRVSSTWVRECLQAGDFNMAAQLLGRSYCITGRVQHGDKIGRTLDFPTANVALNRFKPCLHGIYAVNVSAPSVYLPKYITQGLPGLNAGHAELPAGDSVTFFGAGHVGTRPAVDGQTWRLEVHLPKAQAQLYGLRLTVEFLHFLHAEYDYASLEALKTGIALDVQHLLAYWQQQSKRA